MRRTNFAKDQSMALAENVPQHRTDATTVEPLAHLGQDAARIAAACVDRRCNELIVPPCTGRLTTISCLAALELGLGTFPWLLARCPMQVVLGGPAT